MGVFDEYNISPTPEEADARATFSDWRAVGEDVFRAAMALEAELARGEEQAPAGR